jgi:hypothetical protein
MTNSRLQRAASHIDATELASGKWAHYADETSSWHVVTGEELEELCDYLDDEDEQIRGDAYSHWCAGTGATEMPRWWSPETKDAVLVETMPEQHRESHRAAGNWGDYPHNGAERRIMHRADAEALCGDDEYNRILRDAKPADVARYSVV